MDNLRTITNIECTLKRRITTSIKKRFTEELAKHGFIAGKRNFWVCVKTNYYWFIHLHTFTFAPAFRIHAGVRYFNDPFEAIALNGIDTGNHFFDLKNMLGLSEKRHYLVFDESARSQEICTHNMMIYFEHFALPWLSQFKSLDDFIKNKAHINFLRDADINMIQASLNMQDNPINIAQTKKLFGLPC